MEEKNFENIRNNLERLLSPHKLPNLNLRNQSPDQDYKKTHKIRFFQHRLTKYDPIFSDHLPFIPKTSHHRRESENFNTRKFKKQTPDLFNSSFKDELKFALKHISMSPKKESKREKNVNITRSPTKFRGVEDTELGNFIQAMFSNEPSPFRKSELLIEPESIDIRAAEKLLQEANKIVKNGIKKKRGQQEIGGAIEEFWKSNISREILIRWDVFEESFICFLEVYMVCDMASLRKVNWKKLLTKMCNSLGKNHPNYSLWPGCYTITEPPPYEHITVSLNDWSCYIRNGDMIESLKSSIEDTPTYLSTIRKGDNFKFSCGSVYKGEWREGKREGSGTFIMASGDIYQGTWARGLKEDYGTFKGHGYMYKGEWKKDRFHGFGKIKFPDSSYFEGIWCKGSIQNGIYKWNSGCVYQGEFLKTNFEGKGKLTMPDGSSQKGTWKDSKLSGEGKILRADGTILRGLFNEGQMEGEGILKCKEFKYSGQLKNSVPHGVGSMDWITGDSYSGEFCEGNMHGKGHLKQSTGESYIGDFNMNQRTGNAKIIYIDNTSYEGDVKEGKPDGFGTLIFPQNHIYLKYSGHFKDGKFHSEGQLDYQNGNSYKGEWDLGIKSGRGVQKTTEYVYEGGFYNDKYHGFGEFKHGKAFCVGTWINGLPDGRQEIKDWEGNSYIGILTKGEPINRHKLDPNFLKVLCNQ